MIKNQKQFNLRLKIVFAGIVCIGFAIIVNLFYLQINDGNQFREQADGQYVVSTFNSFERGHIYFEAADKTRLTAAGQKKGYKISINPSKLSQEKIEKIFTEVNNIKAIDKDTFMSGASKETRTYFEVVNQLSNEEGLLLKDKLGKNISLHAEKWRVYPLKNIGSHVLGFLGFNEDDIYEGRYGLESSYNNVLKRENRDIYTNFFARLFHGVQNLIDTDYQKEGDIVSTIDPQIQVFFEKELMRIQEKWSSKNTGGIIMNPKTGEIYAMSSVPNFDNNDYSREALSIFKNPMVSNVYEFGSIMKPLIVAMGLDKDLINSETKYFDQGFVQVEKHTVYNFDKKGRGWVSVQDILNQSLNTGMVFITKKINKFDFREYFKKFGFTEKSGIDLPSDAVGLVSNMKSNRDIEFANMSFGQGIAISPISFVKGLSALANNGKTVTPHLVEKIEYTNGEIEELIFTEGQQVITPETSGEISRMLVNVFDNYSNGNLKLENHRVAAKTGTAQIPDPTGGYYGDRNLHSFFGYFPAYDPEFIVFLYTVEPKGIKYASQTLIQPFRSTAKYLINYYNVPPDR